MKEKEPPTGNDPHPYKQLMELVYSADRRREETRELSDQELALAARAGEDPVAYRLSFLSDPRARRQVTG